MQSETQGRTGGQTYYSHLNGLKGLAALLVMLGHYLGLYKYAESFSPSTWLIDAVNFSPFSFVINEGYWLYLFFVVSGYLVAKSRIVTMQDLIVKAGSRFLRLAIPIFFSYGGICKKPCFAFWFLAAAMLPELLPITLKAVLFFAALILLVPRLPLFTRFLSSAPVRFIGKISWGIYSFHWPVICSAGALSLLRLSGVVGLLKAYYLTFPVVAVLTLGLSAAFSCSLERLSARLTKGAGALLRRLLTPSSRSPV